MDACTPENQDHARIQSEGSDLRNRIKLIGMEARIPTQLIKPSTLAIRTDRQRASRAWNLTVGLLYTSLNEAIPGKLGRSKMGTATQGSRSTGSETKEMM